MKVIERLELLKQRDDINEKLVEEVKKLPKYNDRCNMDQNSNASQKEFEKCEEHTTFVNIDWYDGSSIYTFKHCIICGGRYEEELE